MMVKEPKSGIYRDTTHQMDMAKKLHKLRVSGKITYKEYVKKMMKIF